MEELIIRGGLVVDGAGRSGYAADVAVRDGRISAIGDLSGVCAGRELDASDLVVAPGFIDSHAHSDTCFLRDGSCAYKLYQGITTEVTGQCGFSPFPALPERLDGSNPWRCPSFDEFIRQFEASEYTIAVNQALLGGRGSRYHGV